MRELLDQALIVYNLPLTVLVILVGLFWVLSAFGAADMEALDVDMDLDLSTEGDVSGGGALHGILKFVNAQDIPITFLLSLLAIFMWVLSIGANYYLNPTGSGLLSLGFNFASFLVSVLLIKFITQPMRPLFRAIKKDQEHHEPLIGSAGFIKSRTADETFAQCEVVRPNGAPALLNCKLAAGESPLVKGDQILVVAYDEPSQKFIVKSLPEN